MSDYCEYGCAQAHLGHSSIRLIQFFSIIADIAMPYARDGQIVRFTG